MKHVTAVSFAVFTLALAIAAPAQADVSDIRATDKAVELNLGAQGLKYGEDYANSDFDTEQGWGTAVGASARYLTSQNVKVAALRDLYFAANVTATFGDTNYKGGLYNPVNNTTVPLSSTTHDMIVNFDAQIGRAFPLFDQVMITPLLDLGYRWWDRSLTGPGAYTEYYTNGNVQGGVMVQWSPIPKLVMGLWGEGGTTIAPQMRIGGGGSPYDLGSDGIYTFGGKVGYTMIQNLELTGELQFRGFGFGASEVHSDDTLEPDSYTHETTALVGVAYHVP